MTSKIVKSAIAVLVVGFALAACGSTTPTGTAPTSAATTASSGASQSAGKVSANTASEAQIAAALSAAGVTNAERWAREVVEYRPYDSTDTALAKLRQKLTKYNPGDETMTKILGALQP